MPTPGALRPIQRVPSGFPGPGGTGFNPCAQRELGGYHHGFLHLTTTRKRPSGVGKLAWPVATGKTRQGSIPRYRWSRLEPRRITITGPKFVRVIVGVTTFWRSRSGPRLVATRAPTITAVARAPESLRPTTGF